MRTLILAFLLLPFIGFADEACITIGMSRDEVVAIIKQNGGTDITPSLEVVGPKGEYPLTGIYWMFRDYDAIITVTAKKRKVTGMTFWTKKDFGESKSHRYKTEQSIRTLKLDTKTRRVSIEKNKEAGKLG